jgi:hypothetical protein
MLMPPSVWVAGALSVLKVGATFKRAKMRFRLRSGSQDASVRADQAGYAAIDALVALMILSSTLICGMTAAHQSTTAAEAAFELRRANDLTGFLLETSPVEPGQTVGTTDGFGWRREVSSPVLTFGPGAVCVRAVSLANTKSHRVYTAKTSAICEPEKAA